MGKKKSAQTPESALLVPLHPALKDDPSLRIVDTHCHMLATYSFYRTKYPEGEKSSVQEFVKEYFTREESTRVEGLVDVYCEPPFTSWKECVGERLRCPRNPGDSHAVVSALAAPLRLADSALNDRAAWNGVKYNFVMGVHPHEAKDYNDDVESMILEAMQHVSIRVS